MTISRALQLSIILGLVCVLPMSAQFEPPRLSQKATVSQRIGVTDVTITYSRPGVKGRTIWGALVPYDQPWRTGANEATTIAFTDGVKINGNALAAGEYALFTIPGKGDWTLIFNKVSDQWGAFSYDAAKDALRVNVKPQAADASEELVTFAFPRVAEDSADVTLSWEKIVIPFTITVDTKANAHTRAVTSVSKAAADDWKPAYRAAAYAFEDNAGWPESEGWLDKSIGINRNYSNLNLKARMLAKKGDTKQAIALAEEAIKLGQAATPKANTAATEKLLAEWKGK
ncbi:MAG: DUF2911 domain-containing protein [Acidobacteriota bacterium]